MLQEILNKKSTRLVLGSSSPRRKYFLQELGLDFEIRIHPVDEAYPSELKGYEISDYLSKLKAEPFIDELKEHEVLITSDTIVWFEGQALGKPQDHTEAFEILTALSGKEHEVISSVALTSIEKQIVFHDSTRVCFKNLSDSEINYYIESCQPYDKAGSYGIQEWIGFIGIEKIEGSYFNVMGFPVQMFYEKILQF